MPPYATGVALVDRSGKVVAADAGFAARLGLEADDAGPGLMRRAEGDAALRALLAGEGPAWARVAGAGGEELELERLPAPDGAFVVCRAPGTAERLEHAMRSRALAGIAAGLAHDIKNPLNAMALQLALLGEKLAGADGAPISSATHLGAMRDQIARVNEVVRRFLDVADPSAAMGFTDLGALVADAVALFGHEARRRRIELAVDAPAGAVRTRCDPARLGRLVLGLVARAFAQVPDGGRVAARAAQRGAWVEVVVEHVAGDPAGEGEYEMEVAASAAGALGGRLDVERGDGTERAVVRLPGIT
jgi:signal transduction histidine kinase